MGGIRGGVLGGVMALLLLAGCALWPGGGEPASPPGPGQPAPDFALPALDGTPRRLSDLHGRPVLLNFFATWCVPCRVELPEFERAAERYRDRGLVVLLVDVQEEPEAVAAFVRDLGLRSPVVLDRTGEVAARYRVQGLPSSFFVGRDGLIRVTRLGVLDRALLERGLARILD